MRKNLFLHCLSYSVIVCLFLASATHANGLQDRTNYCKSIYENSNDLTEAEKEVLMSKCFTKAAQEESGAGDDAFIIVSMNVKANKPHDVEVTDFENLETAINTGFDVVIPFIPSTNIFFQAGMDILVYVAKPEMSTLKTTVTLSAGTIYRFSIGKNAIRVNVFYDTRLEDNLPHHRLSAGLDFLTSSGINIALNYYHPLSGWTNAYANGGEAMGREIALGGFDVRFDVAVARLLSIYGHGSLFFLDKEFQIAYDSQATVGLGLGLNIACGMQVSMGVDVSKDDLDLANIEFDNLDVSTTLGYNVQMNHCDENAKVENRNVKREKAIRLLREM